MKTNKQNIKMSYTLNTRLQNKTDNGYITIHYKDIEKLFDMTIDNACKNLGISKTSLKKICRHFNISKWPYKRLCKKSAIPIKYTNDLNYVTDLEINNDLSFLTDLNITENPYELEKILLYFY